jgi:glycolate oxidase FAD binding subunit
MSSGAVEREVVAPATVEELVEVVRAAAADGRTLVPAGTGAHLPAPPPADAVLLSTRNLSGIVSHEPEDGTIAARAGTPLSELRAAARAGGHFLTPDVPAPERRTLGGVLSQGRSGPDRQRFGPVRDHVLGMRVLLADGSVARSGGQLVKNVTGFDLHRLYCGSHGTLCVILEAALRLFPEPEHEAFVSRSTGGDELLGAAGAVLDSEVRPVSVVAEGDGREWTLTARLFGKRAALDHELALVRAAWPGAEVLEGSEARRAAEAQRDRMPEAGDEPYARVACLRSSLAGQLERLRDRVAAPARWVVQPGVAVVDVTAAPERSARPSDTALALMRDIKQGLDPKGLFPPLGFHPDLD